MFQVAPKLLALVLKLKAAVKDPPGAAMHVFQLALAALSEIAGPQAFALNPAVQLLVSVMILCAAMLVNAAMAQTGKCEQLAIELFFALALAVPIGTAEHVLDEAPGFMRKWVFQLSHGTGRALGDDKQG